MLTRDDVESYLLRSGQEYDEVEDGMWVVQGGEGSARVVIHRSPPLLLFRLKVMELPEDEQQCAALFRRLLELNATDMVHGAYGIEEEDVILTDALELENLDFNEFQATLDSLQLAAASHHDAIAPFRANC
jgi:hypothetical protein